MGEYLIEKELGQGGMGRVWLVKSNSTGRRFAVKQTKLKDEKSRKAFLAELQTWIDLPEHPNIVPCRFFRTVGDEVVIFTDYIEGGSLADWIAQGKLATLEQILDVAIQFAWGLHVIHERGLVHQDVKPGNVLVTADGTPMVADFGLARARNQMQADVDHSLGKPVGWDSQLVSYAGKTVPYASPEQLAGQPLSCKTDIWSWGVSVLDMFVGEPSCLVFGGGSAAKVLAQFIERGGQEDGLPKMPDGVADILGGCFMNNPPDRWADLGEVVNRLKAAYLNSKERDFARELVQITHKSTPNINMDERRSVYGVEWKSPQTWLEMALSLSGRNPEEAKEFIECQMLSRRGQLVMEIAIFEEAKRIILGIIKKGRLDLEQTFAVLCTHKSRVHKTAGDIPGELAEYDESIEIFRRLVEQEGQREQANNLAQSIMGKAIALDGLGDKVAAVALYDQSIAILQRLVEYEGHRELADDLAQSIMGKANALDGLGDKVAAVALYDQSIAILQRLVEHEGRRELAIKYANAIENKASTLDSMGNPESALTMYERCIPIYRRIVEREERQEHVRDLARSLMNKASALDCMGYLADAVKVYDESIELVRRQYIEGHEEYANDLARCLLNKAMALDSLGDYAGAASLCDQCIEIRQRLIDNEGRYELADNLAGAFMSKADVLCNMGDMAGAVVYYDQCIAIRRQRVEQEGRGEEAGGLAGVLRNKADALFSLGDLQGAAKACDESIGILSQLVDSEGRSELGQNLASTLEFKAWMLLRMKEWDSAAVMYDQSIAIYRRMIEEDGHRKLTEALARSLMNKAIALWGLGDLEAAVTLYNQCIIIYRQLVEQEGRNDLSSELDMALAKKSDVINMLRAKGAV